MELFLYFFILLRFFFIKSFLSILLYFGSFFDVLAKTPYCIWSPQIHRP